MPATAQPDADTSAITADIDRALSLPRTVLPRHTDVEELTGQLRGHLQLLLSATRTAGPGRAATAEALLTSRAGGLRSATDQMLLLAVDCRYLLRHHTTREGAVR